MVFHNAIFIIKRDLLRQVVYARLSVGSFNTKEEAITFAKNFPEGKRVEVWENEKLIEKFDK